MYNFLTSVVSLVLILQTSWACTPAQLSADYAAEFCQADVVFRGTPTGGMSSVGMDEHGNQIESSRMFFNVDEHFKDNTGQERSTIAIARTFNRGRDHCEPGSFPDGAQSYLVFGRGSRYFSVPACDYSFPWDCVPEATRNQMPFQC